MSSTPTMAATLSNRPSGRSVMLRNATGTVAAATPKRCVRLFLPLPVV
jgi:hypothetical protein